jgi:hypothetical protein
LHTHNPVIFSEDLVDKSYLEIAIGRNKSAQLVEMRTLLTHLLVGTTSSKVSSTMFSNTG